jgi:hypothetical protein
MAAAPGIRKAAILLIAALAVAAVGYWAYGMYRQHQLRGAVGAVLNDAGARLGEALAVETGPPPEDRAIVVKKLESHAAAVDEAIARLKRLPGQRDRALTDDADGYLVHVREILRRQAAMNLSYQLHLASLRALKDHMRADDRSGAWVANAVIRKDKADRDFRDYRLASTTYVVLLEGLPAAEKKVERAIARDARAAPEQLARARGKVLAATKEATAEMEMARRLVGPR